MSDSNKILERLQKLHPKQIDLSLSRILELLDKLGKPHLCVPPTIHVAGTNGKGSTIAFMRSILEKNGYSVHVYSSPHLINFNERIRISSKIISNKLLNELLEECEKANDGKEITFFEITTAAAFLAFSRFKADYLLLETGLGGKFDATNVIKKKLCSVITPISMDHMSFLGNTLDLICREKIGIFREKTHSVISQQKEKINKVIEQKAKTNKVDLFRYGKEWKIENIKKDLGIYILKFLNKKYKIYIPNMAGKHQILNSALAVSVLMTLPNIKLSENLIQVGVKNTFWPARMQQLKEGKLKKILKNNFELWVDGGHNSHASMIISDYLKKWKKEDIFLILGMVKGKPVTRFIKKFIPICKKIFLIPVEGHVHIPQKIVMNKFVKEKEKLTSKNTVEESLIDIKKYNPNGKVLICGSLYLAGNVLKENGNRIT